MKHHKSESFLLFTWAIISVSDIVSLFWVWIFTMFTCGMQNYLCWLDPSDDPIINRLDVWRMSIRYRRASMHACVVNPVFVILGRTCVVKSLSKLRGAPANTTTRVDVEPIFFRRNKRRMNIGAKSARVVYCCWHESWNFTHHGLVESCGFMREFMSANRRMLETTLAPYCRNRIWNLSQ